MRSYNPNNAETFLVWALPTSLATTTGIIIIFFSSRYLDVSVPWVCPLSGSWSSTMRVASFGNLNFNGYLRLSLAYRSLSRPSSLSRAKASSICPLLLIKLYQYIKELFDSLPHKVVIYPLHLSVTMAKWRISDSNR